MPTVCIPELPLAIETVLALLPDAPDLDRVSVGGTNGNVTGGSCLEGHGRGRRVNASLDCGGVGSGFDRPNGYQVGAGAGRSTVANMNRFTTGYGGVAGANAYGIHSRAGATKDTNGRGTGVSGCPDANGRSVDRSIGDIYRWGATTIGNLDNLAAAGRTKGNGTGPTAGADHDLTRSLRREGDGGGAITTLYGGSVSGICERANGNEIGAGTSGRTGTDVNSVATSDRRWVDTDVGSLDEGVGSGGTPDVNGFGRRWVDVTEVNGGDAGIIPEI